MEKLLNSMRIQAMMAGSGKISSRLATVVSYDPNNYAAKVTYQPEGIESGWLPVGTEWSGNGWGLFAPPSQGDLVRISFQEDDPGAGIITGRLYNDGQRPLAVNSGEFWLVHKSGSQLQFKNDGSVALTSHTDLVAMVGGNLTATVTGNAVINAASIVLKNGGKALANLVKSTFLPLYNGHTHPVSGSTAGPTPMQSTTDATSIVQAE